MKAKEKAIKFNVNFEYKIVGVGPKYLMLEDIGSEKVYPVSLDIIQNILYMAGVGHVIVINDLQ